MASPRLLEGKVAAITGGLTGIGRAIAIEYLRQGAYVAINHLGGAKEAPQLEALQKEIADTIPQEGDRGRGERFIALTGDVSRPETGRKFIAETVAKFGRLDVFVSNAGVCQFAEFLEIDPTLLNQTVSINLSGAFYVTQAAARQMVQQRESSSATSNPETSGGSIIGISSISALVGGGQQTHYTPTKAGVLSLMQSCAVALGKHGIRCNALLPGTIRTQLNEADMADDKREYMEGRIPLGRLGKTEDMAGPAVFLASEKLSGYVTGAQLLVDGGLFVNLQ